MQQTRLGSSSVTSAIVTACSLVMLQTSCPPGTSFPTCFLQLWPSKFIRKLLGPLMGWTGRFWDPACPFQIGISAVCYVVDLPPSLQALFPGALQKNLIRVLTWLFHLASASSFSGMKSLSSLVVQTLATMWWHASAKGLLLCFIICIMVTVRSQGSGCSRNTQQEG